MCLGHTLLWTYSSIIAVLVVLKTVRCRLCDIDYVDCRIDARGQEKCQHLVTALPCGHNISHMASG
jgi:hypothetical protein